MNRTWEQVFKPLTGHDVARPMVYLCAGLTTMAMHVIVAKARFIKEDAP